MLVFETPKSLKKDFKYSFCPGCDHGVAIRLVAELLDELGLKEKTIATTSIGCSVTLYDFLPSLKIRSRRRHIDKNSVPNIITIFHVLFRLLFISESFLLRVSTL